jgi:ubiquinone/menaquinone biosynthesis C-methylase UbiE
MNQAMDKSIKDFGDEWSTYSQAEVSDEEMGEVFDDYFRVVDLAALPDGCVAADIGCGSGRWAKLVAPHVATLYCVEPSTAIEVAKRNLSDVRNVEFVQSELGSMPIPDGSLDFIYCLGVLDHVPDTQAGIISCAEKLKPGGRMLAYIYYRFDFKPLWYRWLWRVTDFFRRGISRMPHRLKVATTASIATVIYFPLAKLSALFAGLSADVTNFPLSYYRDKSFYMMKTDALDRFGSSLERRFTQPEIRAMLEKAGFRDITFSPDKPYWCVTGVKAG